MKVWLYFRLSRDEDEELNSLNNQRQIIYDYAVSKSFEIVGESFDDNVSGMHFNREGIDKIYDAVENKLIDAVLVKDLSRLGRHRTQTALFIDYLRSNNVRVLSVTENIDTANENDDLLVGFKGIVNDFYAKDISRKIRAGYRQKQKEGIIITAPFGYFKDKNTGNIEIVEESAEAVRLIFQMFCEGYSQKAIARTLTEKGYDTPATVQEKLLGKKRGYTWPEICHRNIWIYTQVKRILTDEIYIGTLVNHKSETSGINKTFRFTAPEEQIRHENFVPAIITREQWDVASFLLKERSEKRLRAGSDNKPHRYTGLLKCRDCGSVFAAKKRYWQNKPLRIEYTCNGYHRYGKGVCSSHRIDESDIDKFIYDELVLIKTQAKNSWLAIDDFIKDWSSRKNDNERQVAKYREKIASLETDIESILMERIRDKANTERYDRMLSKREADIATAKKKIDNLLDIDAMVQRKKSEMKQSIDLMDEIVAAGAISDTHLRMLVDKVLIAETDGKLQLEICLKAAFLAHYDVYYELRNLTDRGFEMVVSDIWNDEDCPSNRYVV